MVFSTFLRAAVSCTLYRPLVLLPPADRSIISLMRSRAHRWTLSSSFCVGARAGPAGGCRVASPLALDWATTIVGWLSDIDEGRVVVRVYFLWQKYCITTAFFIFFCHCFQRILKKVLTASIGLHVSKYVDRHDRA